MKKKLTTLSQSNFQHHEHKRLVLAQKLNIRTIDIIPKLISQSIIKLSISHNKITTLAAIKQFINLQQIDISYNKISIGKQLLVLNNLRKLHTMLILGNPFLDQPLDQDVLEMIILKETDIEILSGETVKKIHQLEQGELKQIFLQNYLRKINYHKQMLSMKSPKSNVSERPQDKLVFNKILPQFYNALQDPRIRSKIKKQTLLIKKESKKSFQEAVQMRRQKQNQYVSNLIKDIFVLVEKGDQEGISRISQKGDQEDISHISQKGQSMGPNNNRTHILQKSGIRQSSPINTYEQLSSDRKQVLPNRFFKNKEKLNGLTSNRSQGLLYRFKNSQNQQQAETKTPYFSFSHRNNQSSKNQQTQPIQQKCQKQSSKLQTPKNQININKQNLKKNLTNQQKSNKKLTIYTSNLCQNDYNSHSSPNKAVFLSQIQTPNSYEYYENIYYHNLPKYDAILTLLFSDLDTLSNDEKSILLEALQKDHKQKSILLYKYEDKITLLKQQIVRIQRQNQSKIGQSQLKLKQQEQMRLLTEQYLRNSQKQNLRLSQIIEGLVLDYQTLKETNDNLQRINEEGQNKINQILGQNSQLQITLNNIQSQHQKQQRIRNNHSLRIKRNMLKQTKKRAHIYAQVRKWKQNRDINNKYYLMMLSWNMLKRNQCTNILIKQKQSEGNQKILTKCFGLWVQQTEQSISMREKQQKIRNMLRILNMKYMIRVNKAKYNYRQQQNLKTYWADQHLQKKMMYKLIRIHKKIQKKRQQKYDFCQSFHRTLLTKRMFSFLNKNRTIYFNQYTTLKQYLQTNKIKSAIWRLVTNQYKLQNNKIQLQNIYHTKDILKTHRKNRIKLRAIQQFINKNRKNNLLKNMNLCQFKRKHCKFKHMMHIFYINKRNKQIKNDKRLQVTQFLLKNKTKFILYNLKCNISQRRSKKNNFVIFLTKSASHLIRNRLHEQNKQFICQRQLDQGRIRSAIYFLIKNSYISKISRLQSEKKHELVHTETIINKMKSISVTQMESVRKQYQKYQKQLELQLLQNQAKHREQYILLQQKFGQLSDDLKLLEMDKIAVLQREQKIMLEKEYLRQQLRLKNQQNEDNYEKVERIKADYSNIQIKYDKMLDMYTKMTFELQKKQRQSAIMDEKDRRQRTIEKKFYTKNHYRSPQKWES